jgi:acyl-CoA thioester hydrolase
VSRTGLSADRRAYTTRWAVRTYELDVNGHVNNSVYLNYAEQIATEHAEAVGFGRAWNAEQSGGWVVRRHELLYHQPAYYGDELELTTRVEGVRGARGLRYTTITRVSDGTLLTDIKTEWVWVRLSDGRPARIPAPLLDWLATPDD